MIIRGNTGDPKDPSFDGSAFPRCEGKVVAYDPPSFGDSSSEGLCDARVGYLVCHGGCFSEFSCDIPDGDTLVELDGAPIVDGGAAEDVEDETDAKSADVEVDAKTRDASADARPADALVDVAPDDAGIDGKPDAPSAASLDASDGSSVDAPAG
jgi:hypothetical protein